MELVFITEARFIKDAQGNVFGNSSFNLNLWDRYLMSFSHIHVMARVNYCSNFQGNSDDLASSNQVSFIELPHYIGPLEYLKVHRQLIKAIYLGLKKRNAVYLCRIPGNIGNLAIKIMIRKGISYGVEVVGDPWDVFAPGTVKHPLRSYFRIKGYLSLRKKVSSAIAVLYVTNNALQKRYPPKLNAFSTSASNVKIPEKIIVEVEKKYSKKSSYNIISVGSLDQMYKGPDILLKAIKLLKENGLFCNLTWLGDGKHIGEMIEMAKNLNIQNQVLFKGNCTSEEVRENLNNSDLFVLASRTEGLPRAIIEALANGLPCIGTNVGGIPELLEQEVLVEKNNSEKLAKTIASILNNEDFYNQQAKRNLKESYLFSEENLDKKRLEFYEYLKINSKN